MVYETYGIVSLLGTMHFSDAWIVNGFKKVFFPFSASIEYFSHSHQYNTLYFSYFYFLGTKTIFR